MCSLFEERGISGSHFYSLCLASMVWGFFLSHLRISWSLPSHFNKLISNWWVMILMCYPQSVGWLSQGLFVGIFERKGETVGSLRTRCKAMRRSTFTFIGCFSIRFQLRPNLWKMSGFICGVRRCISCSLFCGCFFSFLFLLLCFVSLSSLVIVSFLLLVCLFLFWLIKSFHLSLSKIKIN